MQSVLLITGIAVVLFYGYAVGAGFAPYDDPVQIVGNPSVHSISASLHYFVKPVSFTSDLRSSGGMFYRPLFWLSLATDASIWGLSPVAFHAVNLVLHWLNGVVLYLVLRQVKMQRYVALGSVLIWLLLPVNSEVVAWISGRNYLLMTLFVLLALLAGARYLVGGGSGWFVGYGAAGAAALLSHEEGLLVLPLTLLLAAALRRGKSRGAVMLCAVAAALDGAYLLLVHLLGSGGGFAWGGVAGVGLAFARYLQWMILPIRMSVERSTDAPAAGWTGSAVAALAGVGLVAGAVVMTKRLQGVRLAVGWMLLCLLPFCGLVVIYQGMAERYVYLASVGLAVAVSVGCASLPRSARWWAAGLAGVWMIWGLGRLELRLWEWHDPVRLYESSLWATPKSFKLRYDLGALFEERGQYAEALEQYRQTLRVNLGYEPAIAGMGNAYLLMNDPEMARRFYEQALLRTHDDVKTINNYGTALDRLGRLNDAKQQYLRAIALAPGDDTAYCDLATLFYDAGETDVAVALFKKAIGVNGSDPLPYSNLGAIYAKQGRKDLALSMFQRVLQLDPGDASAVAAVQSLGR